MSTGVSVRLRISTATSPPLTRAASATKALATARRPGGGAAPTSIRSRALSVIHRLLILSTDGVASRHRTRHAGKPEMLTQGRSLVFAPEQTAALQFRDHELDEIGEGAGEIDLLYLSA
jgi:hypothetical protein